MYTADACEGLGYVEMGIMVVAGVVAVADRFCSRGESVMRGMMKRIWCGG